MRDRNLITLVAVVVALVSARPYAGGWNDGSRLATVESLADRGTFVIDESIFVSTSADFSPYEPGNSANRTGTLDKLFIDGRYYSDKSPVPAMLMAAAYQIVQAVFGLTARNSPGLFCWLMTVISSGLAYVVAVRGMHRIGVALGLERGTNLALVAGFALGSVALTYSRSVNNHIMLLGVTTALLASMLEFTHDQTCSLVKVIWIGSLAGLGYTIDLGLGPVLLLGTALWLAFRARSLQACALFISGCIPWLILHHVINYSIAGTIGPANAKAEYLIWPGSPFNSANMTGHWQHPSLFRFLTYSLELLFGQKGFIGHNPALVLALFGVPFLFLRRLREKPEFLWCVFVSAGTFLAYAATSNNYSGQCVSVRWFVPLLAPGYFILALLIREHRESLADFLILSAFGIVWATTAWYGGPWLKPPLIFFWILSGLGLTCLGIYRLCQWPTRATLIASHLRPNRAGQGNRLGRSTATPHPESDVGT